MHTGQGPHRAGLALHLTIVVNTTCVSKSESAKMEKYKHILSSELQMRLYAELESLSDPILRLHSASLPNCRGSSRQGSSRRAKSGHQQGDPIISQEGPKEKQGCQSRGNSWNEQVPSRHTRKFTSEETRLAGRRRADAPSRHLRLPCQSGTDLPVQAARKTSSFLQQNRAGF